MIAIGNLGRDCEVRDVNGQRAISFSVAHNESYTDKHGVRQTRGIWVKCTYWREAGKDGIAQYLKSGQKVYVEGMPSVSTYTDKNGQFAASLECRVLSLELVGGSADREDKPQARPAQTGPMEPSYDATADNDSMPF